MEARVWATESCLRRHGSPQARPKSCTWPPRGWDVPLTQVAPSSPAQISASSHPLPTPTSSAQPGQPLVFWSFIHGQELEK